MMLRRFCLIFAAAFTPLLRLMLMPLLSKMLFNNGITAERVCSMPCRHFAALRYCYMSFITLDVAMPGHFLPRCRHAMPPC